MKGAYFSVITVLPEGEREGGGEPPLLKTEHDRFQCTVVVPINLDSLITTGNAGLEGSVKCYNLCFEQRTY